MNRDLESAAHRTIAELTELAQVLVEDDQLCGTIADHARRLRSIAEALARALPGADVEPVRKASPIRRGRPPADHDRP